jgi:hypothetical protein
MTPTMPTPNAQKKPFDPVPGAAAQDTLLVTDPCPLHSPPSHDDVPVAVTVAEICVVRTAFSAVTHCSTLDVSTYWPSQTIAPPVVWHWVVQLLASCALHVSKLLSWHCSWQFVFAVAVHDPVQSALHLVSQVAVVGTDTQVVVQWSSQQAPQDA